MRACRWTCACQWHNPGTPRQGTGLMVALFCVLVAGLIVSIVMLRSKVFNRPAAIAGIVANGLALCGFLVLGLPPALVAIPTAVSAPFRVAWMVMLGIGLIRLGRTGSAMRTRGRAT